MERRVDLPRVEAEFSVEVVTPGKPIAVSGRDLSRGGMQIRCDGPTAELMVLTASIVAPDQGAVFALRWTLPGAGAGGRPPLEGEARLAWSRPAGREGHRIGLQFIQLPQGDRTRLDEFILGAIEI